jgi:hypothetical protein
MPSLLTRMVPSELEAVFTVAFDALVVADSLDWELEGVVLLLPQAASRSDARSAGASSLV